MGYSTLEIQSFDFQEFLKIKGVNEVKIGINYEAMSLIEVKVFSKINPFALKDEFA